MSPSTDSRENREFACELKFVVGLPQVESICAWARARLLPDPNGSGDRNDVYRITSLYFDTRNFDVYHRRGSFGRSKYRIRRYGGAAEVFLERKLKTRGLVSKRRSVVPVGDLPRLSNGESEPGWAGHWYRQRLAARRLEPVCQISYRRTARVAMTQHGPIRLTLDDEIRALPAGELAFNDSSDGQLLSERGVIIEMKYRFEMPAVFKQLVEEFSLNPQPLSKYRLAAAALGCVTEPLSPGSISVGIRGPLCLTF